MPAGTGQYTWIDLNHDGIQQLNEFVIAQFADQATYIRIYTPTNDFVKANYNTFNYSVMLNPRMLLGTKAVGFKKVFIKPVFSIFPAAESKSGGCRFYRAESI